MRYVWLAFVTLLAALGLAYWHGQRFPATAARAAVPLAAPASTLAVAAHYAPPALSAPPTARADSIVRFALAQRGVAYCYAGSSPATGFDCSGFVRYVFGHFGLDMPHSTALLIDVGRPVPRAQARPGDIVVFTGTAPGSTTAGHAGIVISAPGELPLRFVHASSARRESGVKVSEVEGTGYEARFMGIRRVINSEQ